IIATASESHPVTPAQAGVQSATYLPTRTRSHASNTIKNVGQITRSMESRISDWIPAAVYPGTGRGRDDMMWTSRPTGPVTEWSRLRDCIEVSGRGGEP